MRRAMAWPTFAGGQPIKPDTIFHMASCGKQITGIGILMLAEGGNSAWKIPSPSPPSARSIRSEGDDPAVAGTHLRDS